MNLHPSIRRIVLIGLATLPFAGCADVRTKINAGGAAFEKGDCKSAMNDWLPLANKGVALAQNNMGTIWDHGCPAAGIQQDFAQAFHWYSLAAKNGEPMAMRNLGWYYQRGLGVTQNIDIAREWYVTAARWGNQRAQQDLKAMGVPVPPPDLRNNAVAEQREAQAQQAADRQQAFDDVAAVLLGAALGVAASHNQSAPASNTYHGAFTGTPSSSASAVQNPTGKSGTVYNPSGTTSFRTIGNTTYVTRANGTTVGIVETIGNTKNGHDPSTGRTWTETRIGDTWSGQDSNGRAWTTRQVGDNTITTYSDGTTKTCRVVGDQLSCS